LILFLANKVALKQLAAEITKIAGSIPILGAEGQSEKGNGSRESDRCLQNGESETGIGGNGENSGKSGNTCELKRGDEIRLAAEEDLKDALRSGCFGESGRDSLLLLQWLDSDDDDNGSNRAHGGDGSENQNHCRAQPDGGCVSSGGLSSDRRNQRSAVCDTDSEFGHHNSCRRAKHFQREVLGPVALEVAKALIADDVLAHETANDTFLTTTATHLQSTRRRSDSWFGLVENQVPRKVWCGFVVQCDEVLVATAAASRFLSCLECTILKKTCRLRNGVFV
jgi:hypothetical protein